jgi:hypothetical protein
MSSKLLKNVYVWALALALVFALAFSAPLAGVAVADSGSDAAAVVSSGPDAATVAVSSGPDAAVATAPVPAAVNPGGSPGAVVVDPASDPGGYAEELLKAAQTSNWRLLGGLLLIGAVWGLRLLGAKWPFGFGKSVAAFLGTARGGAVLSLACGVLGGIGNVFMVDGSVTPRLFLDGVVMAFTASGGWTIVKKLLASDAPKT